MIVGSGFAGSILAMCLTRCGYHVCMIEKKNHPRFAIGESSTPIADMILRDLADTYKLPFLNEISRYGDWQRHHPEILCGLKRGFSYYQHEKGKAFEKDDSHKKDLLVAASLNDENSDTNWYRSDVDHFLVKKAIELGVEYRDNTEIVKLNRETHQNLWQIRFHSGKVEENVTADWIIDATGSSHFSKKFFDTREIIDPFFSNSSAIFTHMNQVDAWSHYLTQIGHHTADYPYNPDHSALHHLVEEGWIWMLRFKNDLLSCGLLIDECSDFELKDKSPEEFWIKTIQSYPSLQDIFLHAKKADIPGNFIYSGRLQRLLNESYGDGWIALKHTAGFVDPMHSTGIALSLKGVEDVLSIFEGHIKNGSEIKSKLNQLDTITRNEIMFIDKLVSMTYLSRSQFELFHAAVMIYFVATVQYEQKRLIGDTPEAFLCATDPEIDELVTELHRDLMRISNRADYQLIETFVVKVKKRIAPFNRVGLMDEQKNNMYSHTAVNL